MTSRSTWLGLLRTALVAIPASLSALAVWNVQHASTAQKLAESLAAIYLIVAANSGGRTALQRWKKRPPLARAQGAGAGG